MSYENWKILKTDLPEKQDEYSEVSAWCNEVGNYTIVDDGTYYKTAIYEPKPLTNDEIKQLREFAYAQEVDCITAHIQRLKDTSPMTPDIEAEIAELIIERNSKFTEIQERYPYNEEAE